MLEAIGFSQDVSEPSGGYAAGKKDASENAIVLCALDPFIHLSVIIKTAPWPLRS